MRDQDEVSSDLARMVSVVLKLFSDNHGQGLLVTRQIDNTSPGAGGGGGSHKRCELGHTVIRHFSRGGQRIREVIPVPDSLWKETTFERFFAS